METTRLVNFGLSSPHSVRDAPFLRWAFQQCSQQATTAKKKVHPELKPTLLEVLAGAGMAMVGITTLMMIGHLIQGYAGNEIPLHWLPAGYLLVGLQIVLFAVLWYAFSRLRNDRLWRFYRAVGNCRCVQPQPLSLFWYPRSDCTVHHD